jgi:uncharacterized protein
MILRDAEPTLRSLLQGFPVVTLTGPRQSGKTTLARSVLANKPYVSLEDPDVRRMALDDPRAFLTGLPDGAVLDEVQRAPELFSYLQTRVDNDGRMGLFLLTGSQQFGLMSGVTQSLAGRSAFIELLPFSFRELDRAGVAPRDLNQMLFSGGYPVLYDRHLAPPTWLSAYVTAYVERDVRQLLKIQDLEAFQRFVGLCAGRSGQVLNLSSLATDCGITHNTAKAWISVLEASYIVFLLRPHYANFSKRLVKAPKLYFHDTGLLCWFLGIREASQLETHPLRGSIFETFVVAEMVKTAGNRGVRPRLHYWRDSNGNEVDVIADTGARLMPIEIKSGQTLNRDFFASLDRWVLMAGEKAMTPTLIHGGVNAQERKGTMIYGWRDVARAMEPTFS